MINRNDYLDDYGTQVDPLFDMFDKLEKERDALQAHVSELDCFMYTLLSALKSDDEELFNSPNIWNDIEKLLNKTPAQSLVTIQAKAVEDFGNNQVFLSMGDGFSGDHCLGYERALSDAINHANKLRSKA